MSFPFRGGQEYQLVPEGERVLTITSVEEKTSKTGNQMVVVELTDMETAISMKHHVVFIPEGKPGHGISKRFLKVITGECDGDLEVDPLTWLGKRLKCTVEHETSEYNDKTYTNARIDINKYELYELDGDTTKADEVKDEVEDVPLDEDLDF